MYTPAAFAETDTPTLFDFIEQNSFALLVTQQDGVPFATHIPFLLERDRGPRGCLLGHVARANPQWQQADGQTALAVFAGPHAYISPAWYEAEQVVPTWNYVAVHVYGRLQLVTDPDELLALLQRTVQTYESTRPQPWMFDDASAFIQRLAAQIVGFRIEIERIEGKWKLNQNHPVERREKVIRALREQGSENSLAVAALMEGTLFPQE